jgi:hypothetical protein
MQYEQRSYVATKTEHPLDSQVFAESSSPDTLCTSECRWIAQQ